MEVKAPKRSKKLKKGSDGQASKTQKKSKSPKKGGNRKKKASPSKKAAKALAKNAMKKNVQEGSLSESRNENALKLQCQDLEVGLEVLKDIMSQCQAQDLPDDEVQRFLARILNSAKSFGFLTGVDAAVFKMEKNHIQVLEASLNASKLSLETKKTALSNLLNIALPEGLDVSLLDHSREGNTWTPRIWPSLRDTGINTVKIPVKDSAVDPVVQDQITVTTQTENQSTKEVPKSKFTSSSK